MQKQLPFCAVQPVGNNTLHVIVYRKGVIKFFVGEPHTGSPTISVHQFDELTRALISANVRQSCVFHGAVSENIRAEVGQTGPERITLKYTVRFDIGPDALLRDATIRTRTIKDHIVLTNMYKKWIVCKVPEELVRRVMGYLGPL